MLVGRWNRINVTVTKVRTKSQLGFSTVVFKTTVFISAFLQLFSLFSSLPYPLFHEFMHVKLRPEKEATGQLSGWGCCLVPLHHLLLVRVPAALSQRFFPPTPKGGTWSTLGCNSSSSVLLWWGGFARWLLTDFKVILFCLIQTKFLKFSDPKMRSPECSLQHLHVLEKEVNLRAANANADAVNLHC